MRPVAASNLVRIGRSIHHTQRQIACERTVERSLLGAELRLAANVNRLPRVPGGLNAGHARRERARVRVLRPHAVYQKRPRQCKHKEVACVLTATLPGTLGDPWYLRPGKNIHDSSTTQTR